MTCNITQLSDPRLSISVETWRLCKELQSLEEFDGIQHCILIHRSPCLETLSEGPQKAVLEGKSLDNKGYSPPRPMALKEAAPSPH